MPTRISSPNLIDIDIIATQLLLPAHIEYLAGYHILVEVMREAQVQSMDDWDARHRCGIVWDAGADCSGIWFPTFSPTTGYRTTGRLRRDRPEVDEDGKPKAKYLCPYGDNRHLYIPPWAAERLKDPKTIIILVESEKATLALESMFRRVGRTDVLVLALGGCYGWRSKRARSWLAPNGEWQRIPGPIDDLKYCNGRKVYILLDSNSASNPNVRWARVELTVELSKPERNCTVFVCDLPGDGVNP